jgi:transcriptional regulator GlxA family with amidase domain
MKNHVAFIVYPSFELLDLSGPMSVFSSANALSAAAIYELRVFSVAGGLIASSSGLSVMTQSLTEAEIDQSWTALVVGANIQPLQEASTDKVLLVWLSQHMPLADRFGSICSGTFLLRAAGLLSERTVTTHWAGCETLAQMGNDFSVLKDALYHVDGNCWTSAGVTTGIDMAMEMLKRDHGIELMQAVAKSLVIYAQRPGKQSQFSHAVDLKPNQEEGFSELVVWLKKGKSHDKSRYVRWRISCACRSVVFSGDSQTCFLSLQPDFLNE